MIKKKTPFILLTACFCLLLSCTENKQGISKELSQKIQQDERIQTVERMAEELVKSGFKAGDSYPEVWIRDLNTFIELACRVDDPNKSKEALLTFFKLQGKDGNIPDGYTPIKDANLGYVYAHSEYAPHVAAHKNTVETDQESSLIQAVFKYIQATGDTSILDEKIGERTVEQRMSDAMHFLLNERYNEKYGLLWGATTADWGDVQPEHEWGVSLDSSSHLTIDIYDNAMFIIAINNYTSIARKQEEIDFWKSKSQELHNNTRKHLWDAAKQKFIPHIYLDGSPFPADFDENAIYYHGGTTTAIEAGLLSKEEIKGAYEQMKKNVQAANAQSIGLTLYPVYPNGYFKNPGMAEYSYQNGGDWTWFGGRTVQQLIENGMYEEAYEAISPMLDRVIEHDGFYEWWTPAGEPRGAGSFKGSAGVLWKSIQLFEGNMAENN